MESLRAGVLLAGFVLLTLILIPLQYALVRLDAPLARRVPVLYHRLMCAWLGIRVRVIGHPARSGAVLFLANHTSYFDIFAISTAAPVSFVAKREVASWPFFGLLARLQRTVFVDRERRTKTGESRDEMAERLARGDNLVLFPEGTSNDGNRVLPFKSALIGVAQMALSPKGGRAQAGGAALGEVVVQPVSVVYTRVHGMPMGRQYRPFYAWYGDMELLPHLWEGLSLGPIEVEVRFHPPLGAGHQASRKAIAAHCHTVIAEGVANALAGRGGADRAA